MRDFRKYAVWKQSHRLVLDIYQATKSFPKEELYGLVSQIEGHQYKYQQISQKVLENRVRKILQDIWVFRLVQLLN